MKRGSSNVPEKLSTIVYLDDESARETWERNDQELKSDLEAKDFRIKGIKEPKFGAIPVARDLNSFKNESGSVSDVSDINRPHFTKRDCKLDASLLANVSEVSQPSGRNQFFSTLQLSAVGKNEKATVLSVIEKLEMKKCFPPFMLKSLKEDCNKIKDLKSVFILFKDLLKALSLPIETSVTTRSHSCAEKVDAKSLVSKNETLVNNVKIMEKNMKTLQTEYNKTVDELKKAKILEVENADLKKEEEKLKEEIAMVEGKYRNMEELLKKKNDEIKKSLLMYRKLQDTNKECKSCEDLKRKINELNTINRNYEEMFNQLNFRNKDLDRKLEQAKKEVKRLITQNETEHKSFIKAMLNDTDPSVPYFFESKHVPPKKEDPDPKNLITQGRRRFIYGCNHNVWNENRAYEPSTSGCILANCSIRKSFSETEETETETEYDGSISDNLDDDKQEEGKERKSISHSIPVKKRKKQIPVPPSKKGSQNQAHVDKSE